MGLTIQTVFTWKMIQEFHFFLWSIQLTKLECIACSRFIKWSSYQRNWEAPFEISEDWRDWLKNWRVWRFQFEIQMFSYQTLVCTAVAQWMHSLLQIEGFNVLSVLESFNSLDAFINLHCLSGVIQVPFTCKWICHSWHIIGLVAVF